MTLDDVVLDIHRLLLDHLPARHTRTPSGWITFNCVMCADRRKRAGVIQTGPKISYHCFNCGFKTGWSPNHSISKRYKDLVQVLGADTGAINAAQINLLKFSDQLDQADLNSNSYVHKKFPAVDVPEHTEVMDLPDDHPVKVYAESRGLLGLHPLWFIDNAVYRRRLTVPFYFDGELVGYTGRHINPPDKKTPKYMHQMPAGYIFNADKFYNTERKLVIITEGVFDAILVDGVSVLGNHVTPEQAHHIQNLGVRTILCPDRDEPGKELINQAVALGWEVSFPPWAPDIKDAADAVQHYGRVATINSIIEHSTHNSVKIKVRSKIS